VNAEELAAIRATGRAAAADLPPISPEGARRIARLLAEPINTYVKARK
jgi:hypothetical protein